ncbi:RagB/SusD family nutrient uptake outer membrane protein [Bacteroides sp.]|uniref:RagB/SusD family nutrient uptake outer membrane protein n=1 Tax=Bacteroides sp. TaxID=29523 RepID=UPI004029CF52
MKKIFTILLLSGGLLMSGCSDWLDVLPKDKQSTDMYWESSEDVEAILAQGYSYLRDCVPYIINWGEVRGSSVIVPVRSSSAGLIQNFMVLPSTSSVQWGTFYQVISMANAVLKYAPSVMEKDASYYESRMNSHLTEAYFLRGLSYLYLVRNFREVPLITEPYVDDAMPTDVAKSSEAEILEQIKSDVHAALATDAAKETFDETWENKGRATKWALYALMAETCLWAEEYQECITYADYLINATAPIRPVFMSASGQWFNMFYPGNSNESIFEIQYDESTYAQNSGSPSKTFAYGNTVTTSTYIYSEPMTLRLMAEFEQNKNEVNRTYFGSFAGTTYESFPDNGIIWKYSGMAVDNVEAVRTILDANYIIYRMADVMLIKAEALIRLGGTANWAEALSIINTIRERSGLESRSEVTAENINETTEETLLEILLDERDMEFAVEGKRWYDLLRYGKQQNFKYKSRFKALIMENNLTAESKWLNSVLDNDNAWFLPIPASDINTNSALMQNPYYDN